MTYSKRFCLRSIAVLYDINPSFSSDIGPTLYQKLYYNLTLSRLGRLMIALYLAGFGLLHKPALYLSDYFERHKVQYVDHLMAVRASNNMKQWLIFFLYGVVETAKNSIQVFRDIIALKEKLEREVLPHFSTRRQKNVQTLMTHLYQYPMVTIKDVVALLNTTTNTGAALVSDLVKYSVLRELAGRQRNRVFWFSEYIIIFNRQ